MVWDIHWKGISVGFSLNPKTFQTVDPEILFSVFFFLLPPSFIYRLFSFYFVFFLFSASFIFRLFSCLHSQRIIFLVSYVFHPNSSPVMGSWHVFVAISLVSVSV